MKKTRVVIPALALIAFSTAASITGTVAWFSANQTVRITGMTVKTKVSSNLLIAEDTLTSNAKKADNLFMSGPLNQTVRGILEPASTIDGVNFYYTTDAKADGNVKDTDDRSYVKYGTEAALTSSELETYADPFSKAYGITKTVAAGLMPDPDGEGPLAALQGAVPYVDYVFQVRAQNNENAAAALKVTSLDLKYNAAAENAEKAFRVAFFAEDVSSGTSTGTVGQLKTILTPADAANFTAGKAVSATNAIDSLSVAYNTAANLDASIASGAIKYYKVVARMWLEGEDTTCTNATFAALTNSWSLTMEIDLGGARAAVTALAKSVTE